MFIWAISRPLIHWFAYIIFSHSSIFSRVSCSMLSPSVFFLSIPVSSKWSVLYPGSGHCGDLNLTNLLLFACLSFRTFDREMCFWWFLKGYIDFILKVFIFTTTLRLILFVKSRFWSYVQFLKFIVWSVTFVCEYRFCCMQRDLNSQSLNL